MLADKWLRLFMWQMIAFWQITHMANHHAELEQIREHGTGSCACFANRNVVNSSWPEDTFMPQTNGSSLLQLKLLLGNHAELSMFTNKNNPKSLVSYLVYHSHTCHNDRFIDLHVLYYNDDIYVFHSVFLKSYIPVLQMDITQVEHQVIMYSIRLILYVTCLTLYIISAPKVNTCQIRSNTYADWGYV